jgi:hypothetical protein
MRVDQVALEIRLALHRNGYCPLPLIGKKPCFKNWQLRTDTSEREIQRWPWMYPASATNTGVLTRMTPALDLDIMNEEAVLAAEDIVRLRRKHGVGLVRVGNPPKRAIPFRTDEPFKKLTVLFEGDEKIEFLCDGQQFVVAGVHPDIHQPYHWLGRELWTVPREDLPTISGAEARELVDEIVEMLCQHYGYRIKTAAPRAAPKPSPGGNQPHVSFSTSSAGQRNGYVPVPIYKKMIKLMEPGFGQVRARGILRPVVEARESRNWALYYAALQFRELIRDGIITRSAVEELLLMCSEMNGFVAKRGRKQTEDTIKSGLDAKIYGRVEKET